LGIAVGFVLPPIIVHLGSLERISFDLSFLFLISAVINSVVFVFILLFFAEKPPLPPSIAQMQAIDESMDNDFLKSIKKLLVNPNYILLLLTYGMIELGNSSMSFLRAHFAVHSIANLSINLPLISIN
jgi:MFS transporter, FLVCR family, feline leukemia virus subgroup C receptor-related protein